MTWDDKISTKEGIAMLKMVQEAKGSKEKRQSLVLERFRLFKETFLTVRFNQRADIA